MLSVENEELTPPPRFSAWVDINLIITPTTIPFLLRALSLPSPIDLPLRTATADALIETVTKGMPATDKLALLSVLDLGSVLGSLLGVGRENGRTEADENTELFREKLGKLLNGTGTELCKICEEVRPMLFPCSLYLALTPCDYENNSSPRLRQKRNSRPRRWRRRSSPSSSSFSPTRTTSSTLSPSPPLPPPSSGCTRRRRSAASR